MNNQATTAVEKEGCSIEKSEKVCSAGGITTGEPLAHGPEQHVAAGLRVAQGARGAVLLDRVQLLRAHGEPRLGLRAKTKSENRNRDQ